MSSDRIVDACEFLSRLEAGSGHSAGSLFSSPLWVKSITATYGFPILASVQERDGGQEGLLFAYISDVRGPRLVSIPFSDFCDPLVSGLDAWTELVDPLFQYKAPIRLRCLRNPVPGSDARFSLLRKAMWHGIDLTRAESQIWAGLHSQARQNIRHATQNQVSVRKSIRLEDVDTFHAMHVFTRKRKYRLLAPPRAFFRNLHQNFIEKQQGFVLIAEHEGRPIAGIMCLVWRDTLYYKFNASFDVTQRPNELLMWHAVRAGKAYGLSELDLGLSDLEQPGLVRYKRKFATSEKEVTAYEAKPEGAGDAWHDATQVLAQVSHLMTDPSAPDELTREAVERFYRYFA